MSNESTPNQCEAARAASSAEAVVASTLPSDTTISAAEMLTRTLAHIDQRYAAGGGLVDLTTGFPDLDHHTGGLRTGDLVVVAARPSMGKSAFALAIAAANAAPGVDRKGVAMFCLEMGAVWVGARWLAMTSGVPLRLLTHGIPSPAERSRLQALLRDASQLQFYLDESESLTVEQIGAKARRLQREKGLAIVIVDYLQLIADSRQNPSASRAESVREIALALKQLARELAVPVIVLSQVSRALESRAEKRPIMSDLRDSGGLESHADLILFLYRDEVYNPESEDAETAEIIVSKNRKGPTGTVRVGFEAETLRFRQFLELGDGSLSRSGAAHR